MIDRSRLAAEMLLAARPGLVEALTDGELDHCILFTRLAIDLARKRGVPARPLPVTVELTGEQAPDSAFILGAEGGVPENSEPNTWDGHLVAIFDRRLMLDLSIDSATTKEMGIRPHPFVTDVSPGFVKGVEPFRTEIEGGYATYTAFPKRSDFKSTTAWQPTAPEDAAKLADHILWHPDHPV